MRDISNLKGKIFIGEYSKESGPDGVFPANKLSECLKKLGVNLVRFKTGTPARINKKSMYKRSYFICSIWGINNNSIISYILYMCRNIFKCRKCNSITNS